MSAIKVDRGFTQKIQQRGVLHTPLSPPKAPKGGRKWIILAGSGGVVLLVLTGIGIGASKKQQAGNLPPLHPAPVSVAEQPGPAKPAPVERAEPTTDPASVPTPVRTRIQASPKADMVWDGGGRSLLWTTAANWDTDCVPGNGVTVAIATPVTVNLNNMGNLPTCTVWLSGGAGLTEPRGAVRLNGATINVASGSVLAGNFWDMNNGTINFANGAIATMNDWEQKGNTVFTFTLGKDGFTALTPRMFRLGGGATMANATYKVDMAAYTNTIKVITLADFEIDTTEMSPEIFQTAHLILENVGGYVANLQWNNATKAIELNITGAPACEMRRTCSAARP